MPQEVEEDFGGVIVVRPPLVEYVPPQPVHPSITRAQGKAALIQAGLWDGVVEHVATIGEPTERALADVALHDTLQWRRDSPFLVAMSAALGLTDEQLDALFAQAASIEL